MTHLCKAMVAKKATVKGLFLSMDSDHSGTLSMAEFREGLRRLDCGLSQAQIDRLVELCDADASGFITYRELQAQFKSKVADIQRRSLLHDASIKLALFIFVGMPVLTVLISLLFGSVLALLEGWSFLGSFYSVMEEVTTTQVQLEDLPPPETHTGRLVAAAIGLLSLACFATIVGILAGPLMGPLLEAMHLQPEDFTDQHLETEFEVEELVAPGQLGPAPPRRRRRRGLPARRRRRARRAARARERSITAINARAEERYDMLDAKLDSLLGAVRSYASERYFFGPARSRRSRLAAIGSRRWGDAPEIGGRRRLCAGRTQAALGCTSAAEKTEVRDHLGRVRKRMRLTA